jgi:hypothetical protein
MRYIDKVNVAQLRLSVEICVDADWDSMRIFEQKTRCAAAFFVF